MASNSPDRPMSPKPGAFRLRPAGESDLDGITEIYAQAVRHGTASFELTPPDNAEMARRYRTVRDGAFPYLVAESDNTILGYAYANAYRNRPAYRYSVEDSVYVSLDAQRAGIGRALLEALITQCQDRGFRQMIAVIGDSPNQSGSIALHRSQGFREIGRIDAAGLKFGRWLDTLLMQRALGPGAHTVPTDADDPPTR